MASIPLTEELFDLSHTAAAPLLRSCRYPWEALPRLRAFIEELGPTLPPEEYTESAPGIWVGRDVTIAPTATILPPAIIGAGTEIRPGAFIRGSVLIGERVVVGNSTELKNAILSDEVQVPHYNYVGDSILGYRAHMGAGAIASNIRSDKQNIVIHGVPGSGDRIESGLRKIGAFLGDCAEVGCNAVLFPGAIVGRGSMVYPLTRVRGSVPPRHICRGERQCFPMR